MRPGAYSYATVQIGVGATSRLRLPCNHEGSMLPNNSPHQRNLRKGRFSERGRAYSLTKCVVPGITLTEDPFISKLLIDAFFWMDSQKRFSIGAFVIMPDHYHMVLILNGRNTLFGVMKSLGSYTSRKINQRSGTSGNIWQRGYYDRAI